MYSTALLAVGDDERAGRDRQGEERKYVPAKQGESVLWPWAAGRDWPLCSNVLAGQWQEPWALEKDRAPGTASALALRACDLEQVAQLSEPLL